MGFADLAELSAVFSTSFCWATNPVDLMVPQVSTLRMGASELFRLDNRLEGAALDMLTQKKHAMALWDGFGMPEWNP